ncbi:MAG: copper homeostasis protein CutC, partial [Clostridium sp.]|nr:copper homeostasis protein CutC [Clostridium sp.]
MEPFILEACVDSVESAVAAQRGGANRLELCANLVIGGTTPGVSQFQQIRRACDVAINVLIRPRYGDFLYTEHEFQMIAEDAKMFRQMGADGIVVGCLKPDGTLDLDRMRRLREVAGNGQM